MYGSSTKIDFSVFPVSGSTGVIELLEFIKQEFGVEIPDEDLFSPDFSTVAGIGAIIARLTA